MNKQQLSAKLWASANDLRGKMDASEYKNYILGFLFYKFLSEHQENYFAKSNVNLATVSAEYAPMYVAKCKSDLGYFIEQDDLYSTWVVNIHQKKWKLAHVTDGINHFNDNLYPTHKEDFEGVFADVILSSEKLGKDITDKEIAIRNLILLLNDINITNQHDYDVFGYIYEYLIAQFAMASGKQAGEFYTPHQVSQIMANIVAQELRQKENSLVYDPTVGSGSLLLTVKEAVNHHEHRDNIKFFGQENNSTTYNIARMNLLMRGVTPANMVLRNADTLKTDWPYGEVNGEDMPLFVDCVVSNPPYSAKWDTNRAEKDKRFTDYGIAPATKADYAFLLHSLYHLKPDGIMAIVLPHGVLFRGNEEEKIRTKLLKRGQIDAVIGLPAGIFTNTGIPTIIMILRKESKHNNVLFIDASQGFRKEKNSNVLRERDIKKILDTYRARQDIAGFSHVAQLAEIEENGFNLNIPRYVSPLNTNDSQSIEAHLKGGIPLADIERFAPFWQAFGQLESKLFSEIRPNFVKLNVSTSEIFTTIQQDNDYHQAVQALDSQIQNWQNDLQSALLNDSVLDEDGYLSAFEQAESALFGIFDTSPFTDPYEAYQSLIDEWQSVIEPDLAILADMSVDETIEDELQSLIAQNALYKARKLVPNMVIKGKTEVQDGVQGELFSKDFIAQAFFSEALVNLDTLKQEINEIEERQAERLGNASDTALANYLNDKEKLDDKSYKAIAADLKSLPNDDDSYELLAETLADSVQLKVLRASLKTDEPALNAKVEAKYATLELADIKALLAKKWLDTLSDKLSQIAHSYAKNVANQLKLLDERYADTLEDIIRQCVEAETAFWAMADKLVGGL